MAQYTVEDIRSYKPPDKLPPIAGMTYDLYDAGGFNLDDEAVEKIRAELESNSEDLKELTDMLCGLSTFIIFAMEVREDPVAAETVAKLIQEQASKYEEVARMLQAAVRPQFVATRRATASSSKPSCSRR